MIDRLREHPQLQVVALFGPEHGVYGHAQAGDPVDHFHDPRTGLPVYSLYGPTKRLTKEMANQVDVLIIDLPDIGCRYWTHLYTMSYALQAAAAFDLKVIVLDRPNPVTGEKPEGNLLDRRFASFVGEHPIPNRTGLTFGEAARLFNDAFHIGADLLVAPMEGWRRDLWFDETDLMWVQPSPNMPSITAALLYSGTCLIEGTNFSEGRGTTRPFEWIGAPWLCGDRMASRLNERNLDGVYFRPIYFTPYFDKHQGQLCQGVQIHVLDRDAVQPVRIGLHILDACYRESPDQFRWKTAHSSQHPHIDLLAGTDTLRSAIEANHNPDDLWASWNRQLDESHLQRASALIY